MSQLNIAGIKLVASIKRDREAVRVKIIHQAESIRSMGLESNLWRDESSGLRIMSHAHPQILSDRLYLRGLQNLHDEMVCNYIFNSELEAETWVDRVSRGIREINRRDS